MKFVIKKKEQLPAALRRIADEQLQIATDYTSGAKPTATSVHCARKAIKRARAVLKLVRCDVNHNAVRREDRALSDAAKLLAPNRDLHVQQMALKALPICKNNGGCATVWKRLGAAQPDLRQQTSQHLKQFSAAINAARDRVPEWRIDDIDPSFLAKSLKRTYRRTRKRYKNARCVATGRKLHSLRKTAKTFWHQLQLIDRISSKRLCALSRDAARLSKLLGDEHDLYMLLKALADATDADSRAVKRELRRLRRKLTRKVLKAGRKTFALAPSDFHERLSRCVK